MNLLTSTLFCTILMVSTGAALAENSHDGPGRAERHHARGMQGMPMVEHLVRALHRLDLSEEQREDVHAVLQEMKTAIRPVMEETRAGHEQLKELIKAATFDEEAVAVLATKEGQLAAERVIIASRAFSDVYVVLTDEQREELDAMSERRKQHKSKMRRHNKPSSSS